MFRVLIKHSRYLHLILCHKQEHKNWRDIVFYQLVCVTSEERERFSHGDDQIKSPFNTDSW